VVSGNKARFFPKVESFLHEKIGLLLTGLLQLRELRNRSHNTDYIPVSALLAETLLLSWTRQSTKQAVSDTSEIK
jgi:hypothetical protein